ncbi:aminotransferase class I/II-fold pyridoxal phosphate-dependent enzyme [Caballeronia sordidicola]|uniref:Aspartate aminotransferase n=1 Tax=Caballeronia sordidicola TaxID=196367 RepID=A0A242MZS7_CABSO|nr:aminotransferase class I/II-fold pyridoxal phosphate-dependent enzyme [Caballeronia sordidicola]OTP76634.1 Aspartate aminotransferase [Caballeronia sordidicola]
MQPTPFALERYFAVHEFTARYLMCSSDPESMSVADLLALEPGSADAFNNTWLGYTEYPGAPELRRELATLYESIGTDDLIVHTGAQEAIYSFVNTMLEAGDHMIVHMPGYQSHYSVAQALGVSVSPWMAREAEGWALDPDELETLLRPETKALLICAPHNPTGYLPDRERFDAIVDFARKHGLWLFSDEVYRGLEHDPAHRLPAACDVYEKAISLGALSKSHGLAGLRVGWVATRDRDVLAAMNTFKDYLTICNSAPSEFLAAIAVRNTGALIERNTAIVRSNLALLDPFFARHHEILEWHRPRAGTVAFPRLKQGGAERFCAEVLERTGVLLLPGTLLDHGDTHIRIGLGRRNLPDVLAILDNYLREQGGRLNLGR